MTRPIALALCGALALSAAPAAAQQQPGQRLSLADVFTAEAIGTALLNTALSWARFLADIRYDQASMDPLAMQAVLTGVEISPLIPDMPPGACVITAQRLTIGGAPLDRLTEGRFRLALDGAQMGAGCLPLDAANGLRGLGFPQVSAGRIEVDYTYDYASGGARLTLTADLDRLADLHLAAQMDYVSYRMDFAREEPAIAADLRHAELTVRDRGGWSILRRFLPPDLREKGALGPVVEGGVTEILAEANRPDQPLSEAQTAFAARAGRIAGRFGKDGTFVIATRISGAPVRLDERSARRFRNLFGALNPVVARRAPQISQSLPVEALNAALQGQATPEDAFAHGRALITGIGAPRSVGAGLRLLAPLAREGNAEASLLIARAVETTRPEDAYAHALRAAAANLPGALALLDRIEHALPYAAVISAQNALMGPVDESLYGDLPAMRQAARAYLVGTARPRTWRAAYYWAAMAAAAGDAASAALRDDITEALRLRGDAAVWAPEAEALENAVLTDWVQRDVPALLRE